MPTYPYRCTDVGCRHEFEVVKPLSCLDHPEACERCGSSAERYIGRTHFYGASDWDRAEYNPGLGCVTRNARHRREMARRLGVEEVGNERPEAIHAASESTLRQKLENRWKDV